MRTFLYLVRMTFLTKFAYMKAFWFNAAGTAASIFIYYFLWQFVFQKQETLQGFTMTQMTSYVILSRMLASQFAGGINMEFAQWIYDGAIGVELLRPVSLFFTLFAKRVGEFAFFVLFKGMPITLIGLLLLGGEGPAGGWNFLLFLCSVCVSIGIMFFFEFMVGLCSFYTLHMYGMSFTKSALLSILSGGIVPLFLFPPALAEVLNYMPFAGMVSVPVQIFLGKYEYQQALPFMGLQMIWLVLLLLLSKVLYQIIIKKVVVQGG